MAKAAVLMVRDEADNPVSIPGSWVICHHCKGSGGSSAYLGAFSRDEFEEAFDYDEREAYFRGDYDRPCEFCGGSGKVVEVDVKRCSFAEKRALVWERRRARWDAEARAEARRESLMLGEY